MVEVEIRAPVYDEEDQTTESKLVALVTADGGSLAVEPAEARWAVPDAPVVSMSTGKSINSDDDPEEWARNLPYAYRSGDLVAVLRRDDDPPDIDAREHDDAVPEIPQPVSSELGDELLAN